jgi:outer membrane lipoprotein
MRAWLTSFLIFLTVLSVESCTSISKQYRKEAGPLIPFKTLVKNMDQYKGRTVILGGYILELRNGSDETLITVLQAPLNYWGHPKSRGLSEGRFIISQEGTLEAEAYNEGRGLTVAGKVAGQATQKIESCPFPCLQIESLEIELRPRFAFDFLYPSYDPSRIPQIERVDPYQDKPH